MGSRWALSVVAAAAVLAGSVRGGGLDPGAMMPVPKPKPKPSPAVPAPHKGRIYRHAIGFSFWYPLGWTVKEHDDGLQLIPPKPAATAQGPSELYFITGESVAGEGIQHAGDVRVGQYLDGEIRKLSPTMVRAGQPATVAMAKGQGVLLQWQGRSATGNVMHARAYVAIIRDHGVSLIGLGDPKHVQGRDAELRRMFASFDVGQGTIDRQLVGAWKLKAVSSITNWSVWETAWSRAQAVNEEQSTMALRADGTWRRVTRRHFLAGAGGVWVEDNSEKITEGRWFAGNSQLYFLSKHNAWDDYRYQVVRGNQGIQLRLASGTKGTLWDRVP